MLSKDGVVVVTGAGRGLGLVIARHVVEKGFSVALLSRTLSDLNQARDDLQESLHAGKSISVHNVDLSDSGDVKECFRKLTEHHQSGISALINNAATWTGGKNILTLNQEDLQRSLDLNFFSAFNCIKETLATWTAKKAPLAILNIGATASKRGGKNTFAFAMAKSSIQILSQSLARELGPEEVHVAHLVIDGLIDNTRTRKLNPQVPDHKYIQMSSLAQEIVHVMLQGRDCWTFEWDVRTSTCDW